MYLKDDGIVMFHDHSVRYYNYYIQRVYINVSIMDVSGANDHEIRRCELCEFCE